MSAPSPEQPTIRFVEVDGVRLRTWVRGSGRPLLLVTGRPAGHGRILARCIPRARLRVVPGGGHLFLLERPAATAAVVAGFLEAEEGGDVGTTTG